MLNVVKHINLCICTRLNGNHTHVTKSGGSIWARFARPMRTYGQWSVRWYVSTRWSTIFHTAWHGNLESCNLVLQNRSPPALTYTSKLLNCIFPFTNHNLFHLLFMYTNLARWIAGGRRRSLIGSLNTTGTLPSGSCSSRTTWESTQSIVRTSSPST
jgi:hypothetical protein